MGRIATALLACAVIAACSPSAGGAPPTVAPGTTVLPVDWTPPPDPTPDPDAGETPRPVPQPPSYVTLTKREWQKVVKNPDASLGSGYRLWACITQFDAATGADTFRGDASYEKLRYWFEGDNAMFTGNAAQLADYVAGDIVSMSVVNLGSLSYDTQIGGNTTVPWFEVVKIKREKGSCE